MKKWIILLVVVRFISYAEAAPLNSTQLLNLRAAIIELCRGGTIEERSSKIAVTASAKGTIVVIKGLLEGGGDATAEITREQWRGIAALANNPDGYTKCVEESLKSLVPALTRD